MTINYTEKGIELHQAIVAAGHWLQQVDGVWKSDNDPAVQAIIDAFDPLPFAKKARIAAIKADGLTRVQVIFPGIASVDMLDVLAQILLSIAPAARQTTTRVSNASAIYTAAVNGITAVNACTTLAQVAAVVVAWP